MSDFEKRAAEGVTRTVFPTAKPPLWTTDTGACVQITRTPADPDATEKTRHLLAALYDMSRRKAMLFGQQNAAHIGISIDRHDGTQSDVKQICGSHPAVVGIDALSFTGYEGTLLQAIEVTRQVHRENVIVTISMHAPNFAVCDEAFSGYSSNITSPSIVNDILPGGAYHAKYLRYLDLLADYATAIVDDEGECIPVIFRPFHENNGSWFWWGGGYCTPYEYKELFRYTIQYLQMEKKIHHFLYAYSPNGPFATEAEYLDRYPGDDFIDIIGFDMYHDRPTVTDSWMETLVQTCRLTASIARDHNKMTAVTETGIRMLDTSLDGLEYEGLSPTDNPRPNWFMECFDAILSDPLASENAFLLVWANFSKSQFWTPYCIDDQRGHEMINEYTAFLNDPRVILAQKMG